MESIPTSVREKLDTCGLEMSENEWRSLPAPARQRLIDLSVDRRIAKRAYFGFVSWLRETFVIAAEG